MTNPCPGYRVTTGYDRRGSWARGYHGAYDYAAPSGARVVAAAGGRVTHVGWGGWGRAYGAHIIIETDGIRHLYAHLSRTTVRVNQAVRTGQQIGNVGTTGNSTGPHLHYEERVRPWGYNNNRRPRFPQGRPSQQEDDDMPISDNDAKKIAAAVWDFQIASRWDDKGNYISDRNKWKKTGAAYMLQTARAAAIKVMHRGG